MTETGHLAYLHGLNLDISHGIELYVNKKSVICTFKSIFVRFHHASAKSTEKK